MPYADAVTKFREICGALPSARARTFGDRPHIEFQVGDVPGKQQFARLYAQGEALRLELQTVDPVIAKDPRFVARTGFRRWYRVELELPTSPSWEVLAPLLADSHRLGTVGFDPRELAIEPLANTHVLFRRAYEAADERARPPPPFHLGGPIPSCPAREQIAIAVECVARVLAHADAAAKKEAKAILAEVESLRGTEGVEEKNAARKRLVELGKDVRKDPEVVSIARRAAGATASLLRGKADLVFTSVAGALVRTVKVLGTHEDVSASRTFLEWLDRRICMAEASAAIEARRKEKLAVDRVILRAAPDLDGHPTAFLVRLAEGRYGLVARIGKRSTWTTGSRDDVAASAPEGIFGEVATALIAAETEGDAVGNPGGVSAEKPKTSDKKAQKRKRG